MFFPSIRRTIVWSLSNFILLDLLILCIILDWGTVGFVSSSSAVAATTTTTAKVGLFVPSVVTFVSSFNTNFKNNNINIIINSNNNNININNKLYYDGPYVTNVWNYNSMVGQKSNNQRNQKMILYFHRKTKVTTSHKSSNSNNNNNNNLNHNYKYYNQEILFSKSTVRHSINNDNNINNNNNYFETISEKPVIPNGMPPPARLRQLLQSVTEHRNKINKNNNNKENNHHDANVLPTDSILLLPCCYDGLSARMIGLSNLFHGTFLTGFGVSAVRGYPDTQLVSYHEMIQTASIVSEALTNVALECSTTNHNNNKTFVVPLPCIADGDTGYGNSMNVKRTIFGYARAGMAGVMIEDQVSPKRCGHVRGKSVVSLNEAISRIQAASDARDEYEALHGPGTGPLIVARTDALTTNGFEDALERCLAFQRIGKCDITFLEAPESIEQMKVYCDTVPGYKLANMLEQGTTPILSPKELYEIGYTMAAYPLTLLSASMKAMEESLYRIKHGIPTDDIILPFEEAKHKVGFTRYFQEESRYKV